MKLFVNKGISTKKNYDKIEDQSDWSLEAILDLKNQLLIRKTVKIHVLKLVKQFFISGHVHYVQYAMYMCGSSYFLLDFTMTCCIYQYVHRRTVVATLSIKEYLDAS